MEPVVESASPAESAVLVFFVTASPARIPGRLPGTSSAHGDAVCVEECEYSVIPALGARFWVSEHAIVASKAMWRAENAAGDLLLLATASARPQFARIAVEAKTLAVHYNGGRDVLTASITGDEVDPVWRASFAYPPLVCGCGEFFHALTDGAFAVVPSFSTAVADAAVSYTHLTLPTICSV